MNSASSALCVHTHFHAKKGTGAKMVEQLAAFFAVAKAVCSLKENMALEAANDGFTRNKLLVASSFDPPRGGDWIIISHG